LCQLGRIYLNLCAVFTPAETVNWWCFIGAKLTTFIPEKCIFYQITHSTLLQIDQNDYNRDKKRQDWDAVKEDRAQCLLIPFQVHRQEVQHQGSCFQTQNGKAFVLARLIQQHPRDNRTEKGVEEDKPVDTLEKHFHIPVVAATQASSEPGFFRVIIFENVLNGWRP
jgi:hypothetical protein